jgi:hypothetical protein
MDDIFPVLFASLAERSLVNLARFDYDGNIA